MAQHKTPAYAEPSTQRAPHIQHPILRPLQLTDSFGLVLALILLDYLAVSTLLALPWGRVVVNLLLGLTLFFSLRTARARRLWQFMAALVLIGSAVAAVAAVGSELSARSEQLGAISTLIAWLLLLVAPFAISRRLSAHRVVTTETVLGAVDVYLMIGFSFAAIYAAMDYFTATPFFINTPHASINDYLFFSYTTLTTVGYGNLVPAGNLGQTTAVLEALLGQVYLVIIVARLVSLWSPRNRHATPEGEAETAEPPNPTIPDSAEPLDADGPAT